jgi:hypothetical protein
VARARSSTRRRAVSSCRTYATKAASRSSMATSEAGTVGPSLGQVVTRVGRSRSSLVPQVDTHSRSRMRALHTAAIAVVEESSGRLPTRSLEVHRGIQPQGRRAVFRGVALEWVLSTKRIGRSLRGGACQANLSLCPAWAPTRHVLTCLTPNGRAGPRVGRHGRRGGRLGRHDDD